MNIIYRSERCIISFRRIASCLLCFATLSLTSCVTPMSMDERLEARQDISRVSEYKLSDKSFKLVVTGGRFASREWVKRVWYNEAGKLCQSDITVAKIEEEDVYTKKGSHRMQLTGTFTCD